MATDPLQPSASQQDSDPTFPLPPPQVGHSQIDGDFFPEYNLDEVQFRAIELTVQGLGDVQIAEMLSINRRTLWRWKTLDEDYR